MEKQESQYKKQSKIYSLIFNISNLLMNVFGYKLYFHRMAYFAICLLYGLNIKGQQFQMYLKNENVYDDIKKFNNDAFNNFLKINETFKNNNVDISFLIETFNNLVYKNDIDQTKLNEFLSYMNETINYVNSNKDGQDVFGLFFNEFSRYKGKAERGQIFTPDYITSLLCKILDVKNEDVILDGTCGTASFLIKSWSMINNNNNRVNNLLGVEIDKELWSLAILNFYLHNININNLKHLDIFSSEALKFIKDKKVNKVLMNPPFETKYDPIGIISNILNNVEVGALCSFILPIHKMKPFANQMKELFKMHHLKTIIILPKNVFNNTSVRTCGTFIFEAFKPQNNQLCRVYHIEEDGMETVKFQGRRDVFNKWYHMENKWVDIIKNNKEIETCYHFNPNETIDALDALHKDQTIWTIEYDTIDEKIREQILYENKDLAYQYGLDIIEPVDKGDDPAEVKWKY